LHPFGLCNIFALGFMAIRILLSVFSILFFIRVSNATEKLPVYVSIAPQKYFVQQIGKELVDVQGMVKPGASPHTYEPKPRQMADISKTKICFAIGVTFEEVWLKKIAAANPKMKVVRTDQGIEKIPMPAYHCHAQADEHHDESDYHEMGAPDEDQRGGLDPHIWLSPPLVKVQARTIRNRLQAIDPSQRAVYAANYQQFISQIDRLDLELKTILKGKQGLQFMVFHPSWSYFAHAYGLEQVSMEIEGKTPKPAQLKDLIKHAREKKIKVIFVQPQFSTKSAELVAKAIDGQVVFANPLAENWLANMRQVATKFRDALR
jgi:zinc transport system substrate-binding protein